MIKLSIQLRELATKSINVDRTRDFNAMADQAAALEKENERLKKDAHSLWPLASDALKRERFPVDDEQPTTINCR
jgi:hypothetical protein